MSLQVGIVGLPNVGKSTLFNAVSAAGAEAANYPFATIEPNVGVVAVPDARLERLADLSRSAKVVPTSIEFLDIAGLVRGASTGEGLGNKFLSHIREVDAIIHVVRAFADDDVVHVDGSVDPLRDMEVIDAELLIKDLETVDKRVDKSRRTARSGNNAAAVEAETAAHLSEHLQTGAPARSFREDGGALAVELGLLTAKPVLYAANVAEHELPLGEPDMVDPIRKRAEDEGAEVVVICAEAEAQISELDTDDRAEFLTELGLEQSGLDQLITSAYRLLGLITFLTTGPTESRAWTIRSGTSAPLAAGTIHSDMQRGFIRAEVISYTDYDRLETEAAAREAGKLRLEGKDYIVADGDVMHFRFNV